LDGSSEVESTAVSTQHRSIEKKNAKNSAASSNFAQQLPFVYFFLAPPDNEVECSDGWGGLVQAGCNIINNLCVCKKIHTCASQSMDESPFGFLSRDECEANLAVMLAYEISDQRYAGTFLYTFFKTYLPRFLEDALLMLAITK